MTRLVNGRNQSIKMDIMSPHKPGPSSLPCWRCLSGSARWPCLPSASCQLLALSAGRAIHHLFVPTRLAPPAACSRQALSPVILRPLRYRRARSLGRRYFAVAVRCPPLLRCRLLVQAGCE